MKENKSKSSLFRPLVYVSIFILSVIAIQLKKADVMSDRTREAVSIPREIDTHGWPVDVEKIGAVDLNDTLRFTLQPENGAKASFYVSRGQIAKIKVGQKVLDSQHSDVIGEIGFVAGRANLSNGLYEVSVNLTPKGNEKLKEFASANVVVNTLKGRLSVSAESVQFEGDKSFVWISQDGKASRVEVKLGSLTGGRYEVLSGLEGEDLVIISGQKALEIGSKLRVRDCKGCEEKEEVKS